MDFEKGVKNKAKAARIVCIVVGGLFTVFGLFFLLLAATDDWAYEFLILTAIALVPGLLFLLIGVKVMDGKKEVQMFRESVSQYGDYEEIMAYVSKLKPYPVRGDLRFDQNVLAYRNQLGAAVVPAALIKSGYYFIMNYRMNFVLTFAREYIVCLGIQGRDSELEIRVSNEAQAKELLAEFQKCYPDMKLMTFEK